MGTETPPSGGWFCSENGGGAEAWPPAVAWAWEEPDDDDAAAAAATEAAVGTVGDFRFLAPPVLPPEVLLLAFDTGTVIVDAEVTATGDALVVLVLFDDDSLA